MANYQYTTDLIEQTLFKAREPTDASSDYYAAALIELNRAYQALWLGGSEINPLVNERWWWLRATGVLTLQSPVTTGTVTATTGLTAISFSSAPSASVAGWHLRIGTDGTLYRVASHNAGASNATLDAVFTGPVDGPGLSYVLMKLEYDLSSSILALISPMRCFTANGREQSIEGMELSVLVQRWPPSSLSHGAPSAFAPLSETRVRFNTAGATDRLLRVEYDYLQRPADLTGAADEEPLVPYQYRRLLCDVAASMLLKDKNDDRAGVELDMARALLTAMARENRRRWYGTSKFAHVYPRAVHGAASDSVVRTESGAVLG